MFIRLSIKISTAKYAYIQATPPVLVPDHNEPLLKTLDPLWWLVGLVSAFVPMNRAELLSSKCIDRKAGSLD